MQAIKHCCYTLLAILLGSLASFGATSVTVAGCAEAPGGPAQLILTLSEVDEGVTALEVDFAIPEASVGYAGGAAVAERLTATHAVQAGVRQGHLRVAIYSTSLAPLTAGALCSVPLSLLPEPGHFTLEARAIGSKADGTGVEVAVEWPQVSVLAPKLQLSAFETDFGRVPIRSTHTNYVTLRNAGTTAATIAPVESTHPELTFANLPATLGAGESVDLAVAYTPEKRAKAWQGRLAINSDGVAPRQQLVVKAVPFSVNELRVDYASGVADTEVPVTLRFNNMEPIVGMDVAIPLPVGIDYVEGSAQLAERAPEHSLTAGFNAANRTLRLVMHNLQNRAVEGTDGAIATFRVKLTASAGWYRLNPTAVLANAEGENMTSAVYGEYVSVNAPSMDAASQLELGAGPVTAPNTRSFAINNYGSAPLTIDRVAFLGEGFSCATPLPVVIPEWGSGSLEVSCEGTAGSYVSTMNVYTNDPSRRLHTVALTASLYEPNSLALTSEPGAEGVDCRMGVVLSNYTPITAMQFDLDWSADLTLSASDVEKSPRLTDHVAVVAPLAPGRHRIVIYSPTNAPILPGEGELLALHHRGPTDFSTPVQLSSILLTPPDGKANLLSPGASHVWHTVAPIPATSLQLSYTDLSLKEEETATVAAELLPANATYRTLTWSSSNPAVATVTPTGLITAHSPGTAVITVAATNGPADSDTSLAAEGVSSSVTVRVDRTTSLPGVDATPDSPAPSLLYDLQGRPVLNPAPGPYLTPDGRKVVVN